MTVGMLMQTISETYRTYLRDRIDTMKSIVSVIADTDPDKICILEKMAEDQPDMYSDSGSSNAISFCS